VRPVRLHVEGFGIFRAPLDLSFEDVDYFALVGPTGAGKSTIIDAICFALYGSIPRYGDERLVARVVTLGSQQAKVSLTFDVAGERYHATRVVRLGKGKADALLERDVEGGTEVVASGAREMKGAVERLLGLPFAHFTKCVVLPQGEFAKFLHDEPARRRDLLTRLLDVGVYERIGQRARETAKEAGKAVELYQAQLHELAFATPETRERAATRVEGLRELYRIVDGARADEERDLDALREADAAVVATDARVTVLGAVRIPDDAADVASALDAARTALDAAAQAATDAIAARDSAERDAEDIGDRAGLVRALEAHDVLAEVEQALASANAERTERTAELETVGELLERARANVTDAHAAYEAARTANVAHDLAAHLQAGEPCPVCTQVVATVPKRKRVPALTKAEAALGEAQELLTTAEQAHTHAGNASAAAVATVEQITTRVEALRTELADAPARAGIEALLSRLDDALARHQAARTAEQKARVAQERATKKVRAVETEAERSRAQYRDARDALLRVGSDPPAPVEDLASSWHELAEWAASAVTAQRDAAAAARAEVDKIQARRHDRLDGLVAHARAAGLDGTAATLGDLRDAVVGVGADARHELERIDDALDRAVKLREQSDAARSDHDVARTLGELLTSNRFEKWMLAEALTMLVEAASHTLHALTQGHYSLRYSNDEEFVVVDHHNADETRSVRTLSGGETFQASLALALALSDQLAELSASGGAKLDAIFCDEGFGSLDADTLEAVAEAIESLGTSGRMVGLVTHVPALAERVPVRYRVHEGTVTREDS
jgi:exonuclease SbcC